LVIAQEACIPSAHLIEQLVPFFIAIALEADATKIAANNNFFMVYLQ